MLFSSQVDAQEILNNPQFIYAIQTFAIQKCTNLFAGIRLRAEKNKHTNFASSDHRSALEVRRTMMNINLIESTNKPTSPVGIIKS